MQAAVHRVPRIVSTIGKILTFSPFSGKKLNKRNLKNIPRDIKSDIQRLERMHNQKIFFTYNFVHI